MSLRPVRDRAPGNDGSGSGLQHLVNFDLKHGADIFSSYRSDHLVDDGALTTDDEGLWHTIDAPFDCGAAVAADADHAVRIAIRAEQAACIVRRGLVGAAD